jgi:hypothetical protein
VNSCAVKKWKTEVDVKKKKHKKKIIEIMKNSHGLYSSTPRSSAVKSPSNQGYYGYLTQKQLQQLHKYKKEQDSDRDSMISGHSRGRRMKLRQVDAKLI